MLGLDFVIMSKSVSFAARELSNLEVVIAHYTGREPDTNCGVSAPMAGNSECFLSFVGAGAAESEWSGGGMSQTQLPIAEIPRQRG